MEMLSLRMESVSKSFQRVHQIDTSFIHQCSHLSERQWYKRGSRFSKYDRTKYCERSPVISSTVTDPFQVNNKLLRMVPDIHGG